MFPVDTGSADWAAALRDAMAAPSFVLPGEWGATVNPDDDDDEDDDKKRGNIDPDDDEDVEDDEEDDDDEEPLWAAPRRFGVAP